MGRIVILFELNNLVLVKLLKRFNVNPDEIIARQFLKKLYDLDCIQYEPDGVIPPDFCINRKIAIEVRRISQLDKTSRALEETSIPFLHLAEKILATRKDNNKNDEHYWVQLDFLTPLPNKKLIIAFIETAITEFEEQNESLPFTYKADHLHFKILGLASKKINTKKYTLGSWHNKDSGGWVVDTYKNLLNFAINDKNKKIAPYYDRYPEWWLMLVSHAVPLQLCNPRTRASISNNSIDLGLFKKVIVLNYLGEEMLKLEQ